MDKNDILDYVTETPGNTNRAVLGDMLDSFADGGSSDFTTAEVAINNGGLNNYLFPCVRSDGENEYALPFYATMGGASETATAILYKGSAILQNMGGLTLTTSGDIEELGEGAYLITGDCTITVE